MAKKTRRKILTPKVKTLQTTPDLSLIHPILEDNIVMCIHGGRVNLKAKNAKRIKSENVPIMLNNEIQGASISNCANPPMLGGPCTKVALVFPYTWTQHKVNNKRAVLQMGLIGISLKGYPILVIPKKNKIKFSPLKLPSNPSPKIEYQREQWEGIGEIKKSSKVNKKVEVERSISSVVQEEIPPNVIRIETQDDSGEFIEIELLEDNQEELQESNLEQEENSLWHTAGEAVLDIGLGILTKGKHKPKPKTATKKSTSIKPKSLSREEAISLLRNKYGLKTSKELKKEGYKNIKNSDNVYWARDNKQIKEIWDDITEGAEIIDRDKPDKLGGKLTIAKLRDGTIVRLRQKSKTGGSTIEIGNKKPNVTIHNKAKEDGDW